MLRGNRPLYSSGECSALAFSAKCAARAPAAAIVRVWWATSAVARRLPRASTSRAQARKMGVSTSDLRPTALSTCRARNGLHSCLALLALFAVRNR